MWYVFATQTEAEEALQRVNDSALFKQSMQPLGYQPQSDGISHHPRYNMTKFANSTTQLSDGTWCFPSLRPLVIQLNTYMGHSLEAAEARATFVERAHELPEPTDIQHLMFEEDE